MSVTYNDYIDQLNCGTYIPKVKIEFLRKEDESVEDEITSLIDASTGSLSVQRQNGMRRSLDFNIINIDNEYLPNINKLWWRSKFKLYLGLEVNGEDYYFSQGVFCLSNPNVISGSKKSIQIRAMDKFSVMDGSLGGELNSIYRIAAGTNIFEAIRAILALSDDHKEPVLDQTLNSITTPYDIEKNTDDKIGDIIIELAEMVSANVYYDVDGRLNFVKDVDDVYKHSSWDFTTDQFAYLSGSREYKFNELYNSVLVTGDSINGFIYSYKAQNTNVMSNTSIPNVGFERVKPIDDSNIYSDVLAEERAKYELKRIICLQSSINTSSIPLYHLDVDNVVTLTDSDLDLNKDRYLINAFTLPLRIGEKMSLDIVNVVELPFEV
jgi:hypothetical protein